MFKSSTAFTKFSRSLFIFNIIIFFYYKHIFLSLVNSGKEKNCIKKLCKFGCCGGRAFCVPLSLSVN